MTKSKVLIVSHDSRSREALTLAALGSGYFSRLRYCSENVLEHLEKEVPDMIFCTARQDDELAWLYQTRKQDRWREIPILAFTPERAEPMRIAALEAGACDALDFDISAREVGLRARRLLREREERQRLQNARQELARLALTDSLTGLCNRSFFDISIESEAARSTRTFKPYSLLFIDADHFKWVNDTYGHQVGDTVLKALAQVLKRSVRRSDLACRYGGEEFAVILPETDIPRARVLAQRIHAEVAELARSYKSLRQPLTVSIGISCDPGGQSIAAQQLIEQADCALYAAKRNGRNRTEVFYVQGETFTMDELAEMPAGSQMRM